MVKHQMPTKYDSKLKLAQQMVVKTAIYRRPIHRLAMLLSIDEIPESCQPTEEEMKESFIARGVC